MPLQYKVMDNLPEGSLEPVVGYVDLRGQDEVGDAEAGPQTAAPAGWAEAQREAAVQQRPVLVHAWEAHDNQPVQSVQCTSSPVGVVTAGADGYAHLWDADGGSLGTLAMDPKGSVSRLGSWKWTVNVARRHEERVLEAKQALRMVEELAAQRVIVRWVRRFLAVRRRQRGEAGGVGGSGSGRQGTPPPKLIGTAAMSAATPGRGDSHRTTLPREVEKARPQSVAAALDASPWRSALGLGLEAQMLSPPSGPPAQRAKEAVQSVWTPSPHKDTAMTGQHARELVRDVAEASVVELRTMQQAASKWLKRQQAKAEIEERAQPSVAARDPGARLDVATGGRRGAGPKTAAARRAEEGGLEDRIREAHSTHVKQRRSRARIQRLERAWGERAEEVNGAEFRAQRRLGTVSSATERLAKLPLEQYDGSDEEESTSGAVGSAVDGGGESGGREATTVESSSEPSDSGEAVPARPPVVLHVSHRSDAHPAFRLSGKSRPSRDLRISRAGTGGFALIPTTARAIAARGPEVRGSQDVTYGDREQRSLPFSSPRPLPAETVADGGTGHSEPPDAKGGLVDTASVPITSRGAALPGAERTPTGVETAPAPLSACTQGTIASATSVHAGTVTRGKPPLAANRRRMTTTGQRRVMRASLLTDEPPVPQFLQVFDRSPIVGNQAAREHATRNQLDLHAGTTNSAASGRGDEIGSGPTRPRRGGGEAMAQLRASASMPSVRPGAGVTSKLATPAEAGSMEAPAKSLNWAEGAGSKAVKGPPLDRDHPPALSVGEDLMPDVARELQRLKAARMARVKGTDFDAPAGPRSKRALKHMRQALSAGRLSRRAPSPPRARGEDGGAALGLDTSPLSCVPQEMGVEEGGGEEAGIFTEDVGRGRGRGVGAEQGTSVAPPQPIPGLCVDVMQRVAGAPPTDALERGPSGGPRATASRRRRKRAPGSRRARREQSVAPKSVTAPLGVVRGQGVQCQPKLGVAQGPVGTGGALQQAFLRRASSLAGERMHSRAQARAPGIRSTTELPRVQSRGLSVPAVSPEPAGATLEDAPLRGLTSVSQET